ncbi:hypothetical protein STCU_00332 [Strigomonas culicis]|uniref:Uncharacterized protein n=1 Tax=Strigomonas culicis TaxID=28005 RepID=S9V1G2_9TRYP|nr:hypothetical protein STCU_00332 [Strigomonas culicis]|eukprot:EPY36937.1 hypothetical protein STCU_00332 [Strigomonas culicis]
MQSTITDERRCLEVQHQECRAQISAARKNVLFLQTEQGRMGQMLKKPHATLDREEKTIDQILDAVQKQIDAEDEVLQQLLLEKEKLDEEGAETESREMRQYQEEKELEKALNEMNNLAKEINQRKSSLEKKNHTITEWDEALEARERELARCQDQLHIDLKRIEEDERRFGVKQNISYAHALVPTVSQREIMDDFDMSIQHEEEREEIDKEDDSS